MKEKEKTILTVKKKVMIAYVLNGAILCVAGAFGMFQYGWTDLLYWCILIGVHAIALPAYLSHMKKEADDEMSDRNLSDAKAKTLNAMQYVMFAYLLAAMALLRFPPSFMKEPIQMIAPSYFLIAGSAYILIGYYFQKLENN